MSTAAKATPRTSKKAAAPKVKADGAKKSRSGAKNTEHPTTIEIIKECIAAHKEDVRTGVSRPQIKKFMESKYKMEITASVNHQISRAITTGEVKKIFVLPKGPLLSHIADRPSGKVKLAPKVSKSDTGKENTPVKSTTKAPAKKAAGTTAKKATTTAAKKTTTTTAKKPAAKAPAAKKAATTKAPAKKAAAATTKKSTAAATTKAPAKKTTTKTGTPKKATVTAKSTTKRTPAAKQATETKVKAAAKKPAASKAKSTKETPAKEAKDTPASKAKTASKKTPA
ncbi:hypothetical protein BKA62DRAFT_791275 [Auriculariales sp. MPI-PUGE-AT-0066]|nr:hypothetical protein BKA62DRAFT_791275 [Auriculariales sp. MPI-PUGE-AT-0066]